MSDFNKNAIDADLRPTSVTEDQLSGDNLSHDMWEWDSPAEAGGNPDLILRDAWNLVLGADLTVGSDLTVGGTLKAPIQNVRAVDTSPHTILDTDRYLIYAVTTGAGAFTLNLPTAAANTGRLLHVVKADSGAGAVIIDGEGAETIHGCLTLRLVYQYDFVTLFCTGTSWLLLNEVPKLGVNAIEVAYTWTANGDATSWNDVHNWDRPIEGYPRYRYQSALIDSAAAVVLNTNIEIGAFTMNHAGAGLTFNSSGYNMAIAAHGQVGLTLTNGAIDLDYGGITLYGRRAGNGVTITNGAISVVQ